MKHNLCVDDGELEIYFNDNKVLIEKASGNGLSYLSTLLYSITGATEPVETILILATNLHTPYLGSFRSTGIMLDKTELYYRGEYDGIKKLLYHYFLDRDGIEPLNNPSFINCINSAHKTQSYRMDNIFSF